MIRLFLSRSSALSADPDSTAKKRKKIPCLQLIQTVANNGNFMINIGPKADGTIPEEQKKSLLGMGRWLSVNGEAVSVAECYERLVEKLEKGETISFTAWTDKLYLFMEDPSVKVDRQVKESGISGNYQKIVIEMSDDQGIPFRPVHNFKLKNSIFSSICSLPKDIVLLYKPFTESVKVLMKNIKRGENEKIIHSNTGYLCNFYFCSLR